MQILTKKVNQHAKAVPKIWIGFPPILVRNMAKHRRITFPVKSTGVVLDEPNLMQSQKKVTTLAQFKKATWSERPECPLVEKNL